MALLGCLLSDPEQAIAALSLPRLQQATADALSSFKMRHGGGRSKFWRLLLVRGEEVASLAAVFSVGSGRRGRRKLGRCLKDLSVISCFLEDLLVIGDFTVL